MCWRRFVETLEEKMAQVSNIRRGRSREQPLAEGNDGLLSCLDPLYRVVAGCHQHSVAHHSFVSTEDSHRWRLADTDAHVVSICKLLIVQIDGVSSN